VVYPWSYGLPVQGPGLVPFPLATLPAHLGVICIAAIDIVLIKVVVIPIKFGLSAFVPVFVLYITTVDVVAAIVVIVVIVVAFSSNTFVPVFALYIATVHISKGCCGRKCEH
jgi:hypothetical protein